MKKDIFFRMDCPVLIISAAWHEVSVPYGKSLRAALVRKYVGFEDSVSVHQCLYPAGSADTLQIMLIEVALDVAAKLSRQDDYGIDGATETTRSSRVAEEFLQEFPTAKIVITIDTHSDESGFFLWCGDRRGAFETSPLLPVSLNSLLLTLQYSWCARF